MIANLYETLKTSCQSWPNNNAVIDEFGSLTFKQLLSEVDQLKQQLESNGLTPGQGLGLMARNNRNFIIGLFAGSACGAVVMPISHQLKAAEINQMQKEAPLHAFLDDHSGVKPYDSDEVELDMAAGSLRFCWTNVALTAPFAAHVENAAFVRFSSGTTGKAKGVIISHEAAIARADAANKGLKLGPDDTVLWVLPMAFHFVVSIVLYIKHGATIAVCKNILAKNILDLVSDTEATLLYAAPMHIRMLAADKSEQNLDSLKMVISTSSAIPAAIAERFEQRFQKSISQAYGIIELGLPIINTLNSKQSPDAVGHALEDYEVEIVDESGAILSAGITGKLAMRGPGMFSAYLNPPLSQEDVLENGWFMTGDLASKDESGLITVQGREKSMINVSGNKVFPEEVESVLTSHEAINDAKVTGRAHPLFGEIVQADIVKHPQFEIESEALLKFCRQRLSTYKIPQMLKFVNKIEKTTTGKTRRTPEQKGTNKKRGHILFE